MGMKTDKKRKKAARPSDAEATSDEVVSTESATTDEASVEEASVEGASVEEASVEEASVEEASVEEASVEKASREPSERAKRSTELSTKVSASVALVAAVAIAVVVNILAVRHYKRWDFTRGGLFTLSEGTTQTLHGLSEPITVVVLLSSGDPLQTSVQQLLDAYAIETSQLKVQLIDPDRRPAEFIAAQQKYDLSSGRSEDGRVIADAAIVVARGDKHQFITSNDLVSVDEADDMKARPRLEQAITGAIRNVLDDVRPKVCVTTGHGEHGLEEGGDTGLAYLRERLVKNNFDVTTVFGDGGVEKDPLAGCSLLVLASPTQPVPRSDVDAMKTFIEKGGSALLVAGPVPSEEANDYVDLGVGDLFALAGVAPEKTVVFETDAAHRFGRGYGEVFYPDVQSHAITIGIEREEDKGTRVLFNVTGALRDLGNGLSPIPLLRSTDKAVGVSDFFGWARDPKVPEKGEKDLGGPFVLAVATERPKLSPTDDRGPRVVAVTCPTVLFGVNWREAHLRGNSLFVESSISWLGSHRAFLDLPNRPTVPTGVRVTEDSIRKMFVFTVGVIPGLSGSIGVYIFLLRRRSSAKKPEKKKAKGGRA